MVLSLQGAISSQRIQLAWCSHWKSFANFVMHFRYVGCWYFLQAFSDSASCGNFVTRLHEYVNVYESFYISADISLHTATYGHHGFPCMLIRPCIWAPLIVQCIWARLTADRLLIYCLKSSSRAAPLCVQQRGRCPKILTQHRAAELEAIVCPVNRCTKLVGAV